MAATGKSTRDTYHHGSLKKACLEQGMALLKEVGLEKFSLREVARRVGVTPTAIYHHFPNKNDLLAELSEVGIQRFEDTFVPLFHETETPEGRLLSLANAYLDFFEERQFYLDIMYATSSEAYPGWRNVHDRVMPLLMNDLREIGIPEANVAFVAAWCWSAVHGMANLTNAGVFRPTDPTDRKEVDLRAKLYFTDISALRRDALPVLIGMVVSYAKQQIGKKE